MDTVLLVLSSILFTLGVISLHGSMVVSKGIKEDIDRITEAGNQINKTIEDRNSKGNQLSSKVEQLEQQVAIIRSSLKGR